MVRTKSKRISGEQSDVAGDSVRESTADAAPLDAPVQAEVAESVVVIDEGAFIPALKELMNSTVSIPEVSTSPDPQGTPTVPEFTAVYLERGQKMTRTHAEEFEAHYLPLIMDVADAVADRVAPFAEDDSISITHFATAEGLMRWSKGSPYHRGHTEEQFVVAVVTYTEITGRHFILPIYFVWETGAIEAIFNADKVGR